MGNIIEVACSSCMGISATRIETLCDYHFTIWAEEKAVGEDWF